MRPAFPLVRISSDRQLIGDPVFDDAGLGPPLGSPAREFEMKVFEPEVIVSREAITAH
jgi:hypothetical protein